MNLYNSALRVLRICRGPNPQKHFAFSPSQIFFKIGEVYPKLSGRTKIFKRWFCSGSPAPRLMQKYLKNTFGGLSRITPVHPAVAVGRFQPPSVSYTAPLVCLLPLFCGKRKNLYIFLD